ncbi:hypothetical protein GXW82_29715 [Streptacidiphilus sp. 4-A2]|nr:hypothetical protein [Streptacidiphilus sp. 4-A2]
MTPGHPRAGAGRAARGVLPRTAEHFRRHRPAGYTHPSGLRGVQYRLVERDAWGAYQQLRPLQALPRTLRRTLKQGGRGLSRGARKAVRSAGRRGLYEAYRRLPLDEGLAVYAAYWYRGYACNPAAIYEKARELAPGVRGVWVVETRAQAAALPPGVPYVIANTPLSAGDGHRQVPGEQRQLPHTMTKRPGSVHVQTQHGTPLKLLGLDLRDRPEAGGDMDFERMLEHVARWDYLVSRQSALHRGLRQRLPGPLPGAGDRLPAQRPARGRRTREQRRDPWRLGIPEGRTVVLYAPTHREQHAGYTPVLDLAELATGLGPDFTLLVRTHYFYTDATRDLGAGAGQVLDVSAHPSVEELYLAATSWSPTTPRRCSTTRCWTARSWSSPRTGRSTSGSAASTSTCGPSRRGCSPPPRPSCGRRCWTARRPARRPPRPARPSGSASARGTTAARRSGWSARCSARLSVTPGCP